MYFELFTKTLPLLLLEIGLFQSLPKINDHKLVSEQDAQKCENNSCLKSSVHFYTWHQPNLTSPWWYANAGAQSALHFGSGTIFIRWYHRAYSTVVQLFRKPS